MEGFYRLRGMFEVGPSRGLLVQRIFGWIMILGGMFVILLVEKEIDLVIESNGVDWIVEVKPEFTSDNVEKALGQVLLYDYLYRSENPNRKTEKAIVFGKLPRFTGTKFDYGKVESLKQMIRALKHYGIHVWLRVNEKKFQKLV